MNDEIIKNNFHCITMTAYFQLVLFANHYFHRFVAVGGL